MAQWIQLRFSKTGMLLGLFFFVSFIVQISDAGPFDRVPNTTLAFPENLPTSGYALTNAFGLLSFEQPVAIVSAPGETNRLFVLEKSGRIMVITNLAQPSKTLFLDLTTNLQGAFLETGLLGMAFHPGHATNHYLYVYRTIYTSSPLAEHGPHDQLSRFEISSDDPNRALPESELPLIVQLDDQNSHNAGDIQFGPDGYLYLSLGDEGPPPAELAITRQPIDKSFFGAILRIDVDKRAENLPPNPHPASTTNYAIPADNPFIGTTNYQGIAVNPDEVRTEFFAVGFRNPWRMSFDPVTGLLYCGEVGAGDTEELNIVTSGGNYGWPYMEGLQPTSFSTEAPPQFSSIEPVLTYSHGKATNEGKAIMGGIVYRGDRIPQLYGQYVFGDNVSGHIWATYCDGTNKPGSFEWLASDPGISAFGRDPGNGDVLVVNFHHGRIQRLIYVDPNDAAPFPQTLAETGTFSDLVTLTPNAGILPYDINVSFWSDNAIKRRWFSVPDANAKIGFNRLGNWDFPNGSVWIKHFELELTNGLPESRRRIETRFLVKNESGAYGVTYRWDDAQTNALLVGAAGMDETFTIKENDSTRSQIWRYPSQTECMFCHSAAGGYALGFNTWQLNCPSGLAGGTQNQITHLEEMSYFQNTVSNVTDLPALAHATNTHFSIGYRARSYLAANCSYCHQPNGSYTLAAVWDGRITTHLNQTKLLPSLIKPNDPNESGLLSRISNSQTFRMPPVGSTVLDTNAIALVREWVRSFPTASWKNQDIGESGREGDSAMFDNGVQVSGSGAGIGGSSDQFQFLYQPLRGNGQIIARLVSQQDPLIGAQAGVMIRDAISSAAKNATLLVQSETGMAFQHRLEPGGETVTSATNAVITAPHWLRLVRQGEEAIAYHSLDGTNWIEMAREPVELAKETLIGLVASSKNNAALNLASFDQVSVMSVEARVDTGDFSAPGSVPIHADLATTGNSVAGVEFFANDEKIGESIQPPFSLTWTNVASGTHEIRVRAIDCTGAAVWSEAVTVSVEFPEPSAKLLMTDRSIVGNWPGNFGGDGYIIAGHATNLPFYIGTASTNEEVIWEEQSDEPRALERVDSAGRIAAAWESPESFTIDLELRLGRYRRVSLYFLDWDTDNQRSQTVDVLGLDDSILYTRHITNFSGGKYVILRLRGHVKIRVTATGQGSAILSGIFFDTETNTPPEVSITHPLDGSSFTLPSDIVIAADADDSDGTISKVEFFADEVRLGEATNPPYQFLWTNAVAGTRVLKARALDEFLAESFSESVTITNTLPIANAVFLHADEATQGNWRGNYGLNGFILANHATNVPSFFSLGSEMPRGFTWVNSTTDGRALQQVEGDDRFAATWVDTESFTLDFQLSDGKNHRVALYFLDWEQSGRNLTATFSDAVTGRVLDTQQVTNIANGKYFVWNLRGHVAAQIKRASGANAVLSAIFLDPDTNEPPAIRLVPLSQTNFIAPHQLLLSVEASDDTAVSKVEFFANDKKIGESMQPPFEFLWQVLAGEHSLLAKAIDNDGAATDSAPVKISVQPTASAAEFLGEDSVTFGDWKGIYGSLGYHIIGESEDYPLFSAVSVSEHHSFVWTSSTMDVRAPRNAKSPGRTAGGWASSTNFVLTISLSDAVPRKVSFYCLDWDRGGRAQTLTIRDARIGVVLDTRKLVNFQEGKYLSWSLRGDVTVEIRTDEGANAVLSSLFFDPLFSPVELWRWLHFSADQLDDPAISGDAADPDADGIPNLIEYAFGLNPLTADTKSILHASIENDALQMTYRRSQAATDLLFKIETSKDLLTWQPGESFDKEEIIGGNTITVHCRFAIGQDSHQFIRLRVERAE